MSDALVSETGPSALERKEIDRSCRDVVLFYFASAVFWLLAGSVLAFIASIKMHTPGFLDGSAWLTFGRVRPAHLTTMIYGWGSMAGVGVALWLQARLTRAKLPLQILLIGAGFLWNLAVLGGTIEILIGNGTSIEWLEMPPLWGLLLGVALTPIIIASVMMFASRRSTHVYVSQWYLFGAILWFPFVFIVANGIVHGDGVHGVVKAIGNWWFAHNVLGLWFTPIGLAAAYYFIPKLVKRPVYSYQLSMVGFWTLALFYNWAGTHHLIGGPVPEWVVTVGIVGSLGMFVPVLAVAINHHMTMRGNFHRLRESPTLRFIVFGAISYTAVSVQGSLTALRSINEVTHFTHYTIAHSHLGVYAFFTMVMFGSIYYIAPRLVGAEWHSSFLVKLHFWTTAIGMLIYFVGLSVGGVLQGFALNNADIPFLTVVAKTMPYLLSRSVAGTAMTVGHVAFAILAFKMFALHGRQFRGPTLFSSRRRLNGEEE